MECKVHVVVVVYMIQFSSHIQVNVYMSHAFVERFAKSRGWTRGFWQVCLVERECRQSGMV